MGRFPRFQLPAQMVDEGPFVSICINDGWRSLLLALIERLEWSTTWEPETDMTLAESNAFTLAKQIADAYPTSNCGPPSFCTLYGEEPPSWETIAEDYFACYGEELVMPLEMRVSAECGLEYRQGTSGPWTTVPGAQFLPLDASCDLNGGLKIRSDDPAKKSLDILHPVGNTQDVSRWEAANGGYFQFNKDGIPIFIHPNGNVVLGTSIAQWQIKVGTNINFFSNQANAYSYGFGADGTLGLGTKLAFHRLFSGIGEVNNGFIGSGLFDSTYATRKGYIRMVAQDYDGERTGLTVGSNGSASTLRFYDEVAPVPRPTITGEWNATGAGASLAAALASLGLIVNNSTIGTLPAGTVEMQVSGGWIQWRPSAAVAWINLIELTDLEGPPGEPGLDGDPGEQGEPGEQGPQGEPGVCDCAPNGGDIPATEVGSICAITDELFSFVEANFDDLMSNVGAAGSASGASSLFLAAFGPYGVAVSAVTAGAAAIIAVGSAAINAALTFEVKEVARKELFCILSANGGYSYAALIDWRDSVYANSGSNVALQEFVKTVNFFTEDIWGQRAIIGANQIASDCIFQCGDALISFAIPTSSIAENAGATPITIDVVLSLEGGALESDLTANIVLSGTATQGDDYNVSPTSITFPIGSVNGDVQQIELQVINDELEEGDETAILTLSSVVGGLLGDIPAHTVTIVDDEDEDTCGNINCGGLETIRHQIEGTDFSPGPYQTGPISGGGTYGLIHSSQTLTFELGTAKCVNSFTVNWRSNTVEQGDNPSTVTIAIGAQSWVIPYRGTTGGNYVSVGRTLDGGERAATMEISFASGYVQLNWIDVEVCTDI